MNVQLEDGPALAAQLVMPSTDAWHHLLFPSELTGLASDLIPLSP